MRRICRVCFLAGSLLVGMLLAGCGGHKTADAKTELEKAENMLAQGETAATAQPPAPEVAAQPAIEAAIPDQPQQPQQPAAAPAVTPSQQMRQAITSYKAGELEDAVTRLQKLRATPTLTAQQRMAVQDGVAAVMTEIYSLAAKGDSRALQAVKQYEQMQTSR